jgi:hypothetical protein
MGKVQIQISDVSLVTTLLRELRGTLQYFVKIYRVSIKSFPDYRHLLQENYVEYKHFFFPQILTQPKRFVYNTLVYFNMCFFCIPRSFLVINVSNQGKTLCSPCTLSPCEPNYEMFTEVSKEPCVVTFCKCEQYTLVRDALVTAGPCEAGYTLVTLPRIVTPYRDSVDGTRDRVTYQKLDTR